MKMFGFFGAVKPIVTAFASISAAVVLVATIYFTLPELAWISFLGGIVFTGLLAMVSQSMRAEPAPAKSDEARVIGDETVAQEIQRREKLEAILARTNVLLQFADEMLPAMVTFVDPDGVYRYHNRAFRQRLGLPAHRVDGHKMREVLGEAAFAQLEGEVSRALAGEAIRYERAQKMNNGEVLRVNAQLLPVSDGQGRVKGFFAILTELAETHDTRDSVVMMTTGMSPSASNSKTLSSVLDEQEKFDSFVAEQATGMPDARERILAAIENNEFSLYCQGIEPLDPASGHQRHYEILIRLLEEEDNMIPPGAFFPLAEEYGLLPQLDRWVISHLLGWAAVRARTKGDRQREIFFINVTTATLCDPDFPEYVAQQLHKHELPGHGICFEIAHSDLTSNRGDADEFVRKIKLAGCKTALSGFGHSRVSVNVLKDVPLDFLKIDGNVILQMLKDPVCMSKVVAINRIAKTIGITTIAEMVEDEATVANLRRVAVAYAQGFGISRPRPLAALN